MFGLSSIGFLIYIIIMKNNLIKWEVIERDDGVVIVPITREKKVIIIKEYSPAIDKYILTLPGGKTTATNDEDLISEAQREMREEIGYRANKILKLRYYYAAPSLMTRKIHLFIGYDLKYDPLYQIASELLTLSASPEDIPLFKFKLPATSKVSCGDATPIPIFSGK